MGDGPKKTPETKASEVEIYIWLFQFYILNQIYTINYNKTNQQNNYF